MFKAKAVLGQYFPTSRSFFSWISLVVNYLFYFITKSAMVQSAEQNIVILQ